MTRALGTLRVDLVAGTATFEVGLNRARALLEGLEKTNKKAADESEKDAKKFSQAAGTIAAGFKAAGAAVVAFAGAAAVKHLINDLDEAARKVDEIGKAAKRLGLSTQTMSALRLAAKESGIEFGTLTTLVARANKELAELRGKGERTLNINGMVIELESASGRARELVDILPEITKALRSIESPGQRSVVADAVFGKQGGQAFIQMVEESGTSLTNLAETTERARRLGVLFTDEQVEKLTKYRDAVGRVEEAWLGLRVSLMTEFAPLVTSFLDQTATRIAGLAPLAGAISRAMTVAGGGDGEEARAAASLLEELRSKGYDVLIEITKAAVYVALVGLREGVQVIGLNMAMEFSRGLRDYLPESLVNGLGLNPDAGSQEKLAALYNRRGMRIDDRDRMKAKVDDWGRLQHEAAPQNMLDDLASLNREIEGLGKDIDAAQRELGLNEGNMERLRAKMMLESVAQMGKAATDARAGVNQALEAWDAAASKLEGKYPAPPGPTATNTNSPLATDQVAVSATNMGQMAMSARDQLDALAAAITKVAQAEAAQLQADMRLRVLDATGRKGDADRLRLLQKQAEERKRIQQQFGDGKIGGSLLSQLNDVQALEMKQFDDAQAALADKGGRIKSDLEDFGERARDFGRELRRSIEGFGEDASREVAQFAIRGKSSLGDMLRWWGESLAAMGIQKFAMGPIFGALGQIAESWWNGSGSGVGNLSYSPDAPGQGATAYAAKGLMFENGVKRLAGGAIVSGPAGFVSGAGQRAVVGERANKPYEGWFPVDKINGVLGVRATAAPVNLVVNDHRKSGADIEQRSSVGMNGDRTLELFIYDKMKKAHASGMMDSTLRSNYGLTRRGM